MNKKLLISLIVIGIIVIFTVGVTYAFFMANNSNTFTGNSGNIDINYVNGGVLTGELYPRSSRSEDVYGSVSIGLKKDSVKANASIYIDIDNIDEALSSDALVWDMYLNDTLYKSGTFKGAKSGSRFYLVEDYPLTTNTDVFKVYIWLNGNKIDNSVLDSSITGKLRAEARATAEF